MYVYVICGSHVASVVCIVYTYTWCVHCIEVTWPLPPLSASGLVAAAAAAAVQSVLDVIVSSLCTLFSAQCTLCSVHIASDKVPTVQSLYALHKILLLCCVFSVTIHTGQFIHNI